jgi:hypothetical protein
MDYLLTKLHTATLPDGVTSEGVKSPVQPLAWTCETLSHHVEEVSLPADEAELKACVDTCGASECTLLVGVASLEQGLAGLGLGLYIETPGPSGEESISVKVDKADIPALANERGKVNSKQIGDWPKGTAVFLGFKGTKGPTGKYEGSLSFGPVAEREESYDKFSDLPGLKKPKKPKPVAVEPVEEVVTEPVANETTNELQPHPDTRSDIGVGDAERDSGQHDIGSS